MDFIFGIIIGLPILIISAILHELAHGYVADKLGDPTPRLAGRLTFNPISHIDPFMSIIMPLLLKIAGSPVIIGGAKPVPIDPFNLKEGKKDLALVSLAGPLTNIILAIVAAVLMHLLFLLTPSIISSFLLYVLDTVVTYNLFLGIFNLIPIPPLDGSKFIAMLLPEADAYRFLALGRLGMIIIFILLLMPIGGFSLGEFIGTLYSFARSLLGI